MCPVSDFLLFDLPQRARNFELRDAWIAGLVIPLGTYLLHWIWIYTRVRLQVRGLKTIHSVFEFFESGARTKLPHIPVILPRNDFTLDDPWKKYAKAKSDLIAATQVTTPSYAVYIVSSPVTAASIFTRGAVFGKPTEMTRYKVINIFGGQITSQQNGAEHRRHKSVVKGCFGEAVMMKGWENTANEFWAMCREEGFEHGGEMRDVREVLIKLTLNIIGMSGFGVQFPWHIPETHGEILPFPEALHTVELSMITQLMFPLWALDHFPAASVRRLGKAQRSLVHHLKTMIANKREELEAIEAALPAAQKMKPPTDLLGAIVASQMKVEEEARAETGNKVAGLTAEETVGSVWIFILAGHETTGHTLTFTLAYLALFPEWQEAIHKEITDVCGDTAYPSYQDVNALRLTLACALEALRLRDLVMTLPKLAMEDTTIPYSTWDDDGNVTQHVCPIKKGSHVIVDNPAVSRNPFHWHDVLAYNPTRFLGDEGVRNREQFTGFSMGSRQCIGKRFAEVEMVCVLSHLCKTFTFKPKMLPGETFDEVRRRFLDAKEELTLLPVHAFDLVMERR